MVREMVGGCCVCLDERGWNENPLVYCDGSGCNVAVHQACYGIVKVPSGPWFCCKCRSQERIARVKCELCPLREGALKRTDSGGWAHVVCALYIPEVRFGDVSTMEPIIFSSVPHERFLKTCYICEENGRESRTSTGACMNCHRSGCKLSFHVTCAQSKRQLCEEASINGHVQYVGYCSVHWSKRFKQPSVVHPVPPNDCDLKKQGKEKKAAGRCRNDSTSSTNSVDISTTNKPRGRKNKLSEHEMKTTDNKYDALSPAKADEASAELYTKSLPDAALPNGQTRVKGASCFTVNGLLGNENSGKINSPLNTPVLVHHYKEESERTDITSSSMDSQTDLTETDDLKIHKSELKRKKLKDKEKLKKKLKCKSDKLKDIHKGKEKVRNKDVLKKKKKHEDSNKKETNHTKHTKDKMNDKKRKYPQPSQLGMLENGKISSWDCVSPKLKETPDNFQEFLDQQWSESTQFLASKAEHFDVASLLTCLHQLKSDNIKLEKKLSNLQSRRDRLLGVNARLAATIAAGSTNHHNAGGTNNTPPLSVMLSKLNDDVNISTPKHKKCKRSSSEDIKKIDLHRSVNSPDLVMLAAASAKLENHSRQNKGSDRPQIPHDEKPMFDSNDIAPHLSLLQPHVPFVPPTSTINSTMNSQDLLTLQRNYRNHMEFFGESAEPKD